MRGDLSVKFAYILNVHIQIFAQLPFCIDKILRCCANAGAEQFADDQPAREIWFQAALTRYSQGTKA